MPNHVGSNFDEFLAEDGILSMVTEKAKMNANDYTKRQYEGTIRVKIPKSELLARAKELSDGSSDVTLDNGLFILELVVPVSELESVATSFVQSLGFEVDPTSDVFFTVKDDGAVEASVKFLRKAK